MSKTTVRASARTSARGTAPSARNGRSKARSENSGLAPVLPIRSGPGSQSGLASSIHHIAPDSTLAETAHDLNNALSAISIHLDLLALDLVALGCGSSDCVSQRLRLIQPAIRHAAHIARHLMDPEACTPAGNGTRTRYQTSLDSVLQRMVPFLSAILPPGVALHLHLAPDSGTVAMGPVEVVRMVSNLVLNSCAALTRGTNRANGQVIIETADRPTDGGVLLRVRDNGSGMSAATRANLFRPFFTTRPRQESVGLGLVSVLRMVRRAGGTIQVESAPGKGTDVRILLPCAELPGPKKPRSSQHAQPGIAKEGNEGSKFGSAPLPGSKDLEAKPRTRSQR